MTFRWIMLRQLYFKLMGCYKAIALTTKKAHCFMITFKTYEYAIYVLFMHYVDMYCGNVYYINVHIIYWRIAPEWLSGLFP